ncbi:MAG: class I SAM-dependent methyltransferase [Pseudomonadota bacterium]
MQTAEMFWDKAAEAYAKSPIGDVDAYEYTLGRTRSYLTPTDTVLELGCGTGSTALRLANGVRRIVASDISSVMVGIGRAKALEAGLRNVDFVTANLFDGALDAAITGANPAAGSTAAGYDAVLALNLLHLIEDGEGALRRVHGLLKPGGVFISKTVCEPRNGAPLKFRLIRLALPLLQFFGKAPFVRFMDPDDFEALVVSTGFEILEAGDHPAPSRYIVARKR